MRKKGKLGIIFSICHLTLLILANSFLAYSQNFERFSNKEGFNQNTINTIAQDRYGFLWFGTPNGLIRYDGYEFKIYSSQSETDGNLLSNDIKYLYADTDGLIWIGTTLGLNVYIPSFEKFLTVPLSEKLSINHIGTGPNGRIWFSGENKLYVCELTEIKNGVFKLSENLLKAQTDIFRLYDFSFLNENSAVLATSSGLKKVSFEKKTSGDFPEAKDFTGFDAFGNKEVTTLLKNENLFWVGDEQGLFKVTFEGNKAYIIDTFDNSRFKVHGGVDFPVKTLFEDRSGSIWVGTTNNGIFKYLPQEDRLEHFAYDPKNLSGLSSQYINAFFEDDFNVLWIGTAQGGVNKLDLTQKRFIGYSNNPYDQRSLPDNLITSILEDTKGRLWLSGFNKSLFRSKEVINETTIDNLEFENLATNLSIESSDIIRSIYEDKRGFIWIGTEYSLFIYNPSNDQFKRILLEKEGNKLELEELRIVYQLDKNNILLAGSQIVIVENPWDAIRGKDIASLQIKSNIKLEPERVNAFLESKDGKFWVGTTKGLLRGNYDGQKFNIENEYSAESDEGTRLSYNKIFSLHEDDSGNIWIGTFGGGLNKMSLDSLGAPNKIDYYRESGIMPDDAIYGILQARDEYLWISTDMGLVRFPLDDGHPDVFDVRDGLSQNNFRQGAYFKGKSGYFYFGGLNGLTAFKPEDIELNKQPPKVLINNLLVNNEPVVIGEELDGNVVLQKSITETESIAISQKQQMLAFGLVVEHTSTPAKNKVAYKLEGFNEDWIEENTGKTTVTYTNLSAGDYVFKVKAGNGDGVWSTETKSIHVKILPPWYRTWWSYLLFTLLSVGVGVGIVVYFSQHEKLKQRLKFEKLDKERLDTINQGKFQFFTNISHEFRTPLTLIAGPLERIIAHNSDSENNKYLAIIQKNTKRLLSLVDQLITFRQAEQGHLNLQLTKHTLANFMYPITEAFENYAMEKDINFFYKVSSPDEEIIIDVEKTERIIFNLLSNSFKNTPPHGNISIESKITFVSEQKMIHIDVVDNGKGIPAKDLDNIFERFYQLGDKTDTISGGGIGLAFSKSLVTILGGDISAKSKPGIETRFSIVLPSKTEEKHDTEEIGFSERSFVKNWIPVPMDVLQEVSASGLDTGKKEHSILVVENEVEVQAFLKSTLSEKYNIFVANNGVEALEKLETREPDLVISDVMMPEMDGFELCEKIKSDADKCHISVLLLTALRDEEDIIKGLEFGADEYLGKPFSLKHLELRVEKLIQNKVRLKEYFAKNSTLPKKDIGMSKRDREFLSNTVNAIEKNIADSNFGVEGLAAEIGLSTSHFYRRLKQFTGQSPNVYLRNFRLQRAAELLRNNQGYNVAEVMYQIGMESNSYFSTSFKKLHGVSPSEFIKK